MAVESGVSKGAPLLEKSRPLRNGWLTSDGCYPLHPFFFALASVMALMANSLNQAAFADVWAMLLCASAFAAAVCLAVAAIRRRFDAISAVIAGIWVAACVFYADLFNAPNYVLYGGFPMVRALFVAVPVMILLTMIAARMGPATANVANLVMNGIAIVIFITPTWKTVAYQWRNSGAHAVYNADKAAAEMPEIAAVETTGATASSQPDIYYFIFDRYASESVLKRYHDLDNRAIGQFLEERGFYVARNSNSNYLKTGHSLASTFYMDYLDLLAGDERLPPNDWHAIYKMLDDHRVARFLKARGYEFIQYGSWWVGTFDNPVADINRPYGFSEFNMLYLRRTLLRPIFHILPDTPMTMRLDWDNGQCQRVKNQIEDIKAIGKRDQPVYVFAHFLLPHGPYNFASDGGCLSLSEASMRGRPKGYIDHIAYANRIIEELVSALQAEGRQPPIIVIQADEGPFPDRDYSRPWQDSPADELRIKTGIFNAYYFPNGNYGALSDDITPVNSYRILFNSQFGTNFPLLPNKIFAFPHDGNIFEFHDVTEKVREDVSAAITGAGE